MHTPQIPEDAAPSAEPNATGALIKDAEIRCLMICTAQTERLMECALHARDYVQAARYRRLCGAACATCMDLLMVE